MEEQMNQLLQQFLDQYQYQVEYQGNLSPKDWVHYYDFIVSAYSVPQGKRPTVSELSRLFQEKGIPQPGTIAMLYAHGLYILARSEGIPIFKGGFNY